MKNIRTYYIKTVSSLSIWCDYSQAQHDDDGDEHKIIFYKFPVFGSLYQPSYRNIQG